MEELLKRKLLSIARQPTCEEQDLDLEEELCYDDGVSDGEIELAREILDLFCIKY